MVFWFGEVSKKYQDTCICANLFRLKIKGQMLTPFHVGIGKKTLGIRESWQSWVKFYWLQFICTSKFLFLSKFEAFNAFFFFLCLHNEVARGIMSSGCPSLRLSLLRRADRF